MFESDDAAVDDTTDLRRGPELHEALLALLPLVGVWRGTGAGTTPTDGRGFSYLQRVSFGHDGRPFLTYESRTWLTDSESGSVIRPAARELGFWRPGVGADSIEVVIAHAFGVAQTLVGVAGDMQWELATLALQRVPAAKQLAGEQRLYALGTDPSTGDWLAYVQELALDPGKFRPHLNAKLNRVNS